MPDSILTRIAAGVLAEVSKGQFSQDFVAERSYADWELPLEQADCLWVDVVPVSNIPVALQTRGDASYKPSVDIVVRKKFGVPDQEEKRGRIAIEEIDALVGLVEEIHQFLIGRRLPTFDEAAWEETQIRAAYIPAHVRTMRQFTGIIRVTYSASQPL